MKYQKSQEIWLVPVDIMKYYEKNPQTLNIEFLMDSNSIWTAVWDNFCSSYSQ